MFGKKKERYAGLQDQDVCALGRQGRCERCGVARGKDEISRGLIDANLGGHVFKKRVSIGGRGKSGGVRTLLALRVGDRAFFVFGFAKNERSNVSDKELETLKRLASQLLGYDARELREALSTGKLYEVESDG
ncbi:MAG: type II toxin-antitoxin system RelE/ParE family toxin [Trinickia sp.]|uniref:type II toxin-antitoxin system RelE/ParE family toxin n=1 Tax=Trinickia sp. TaxID=2571163 RepID=UPI003F7E0AB3